MNVLLGTTIETNRWAGEYKVSQAPHPVYRAMGLNGLLGFKKYVSIEPVMDFDMGEMLTFIKWIKPQFVSIGADSKRCKLPEPPKEKVIELVAELRKTTEVKLKPNLKRLIGKEGRAIPPPAKAGGLLA